MRLVALLLAATVCPAVAQQTPGVVRVPRAERPPRLEDFLSGPPRIAGLEISDFRQFDPKDGEPASQPTSAYLSYDDKNLYVGWICKDDPAKIRARVARRKDIESDDRVTINIDTFHDHKRAYWFDVNPHAIQFDGITTDGLGDDRSWESLWYTEAKLTPDGYVVLETIPFRSLRFPGGPKQTWGVALGRFIIRDNEFSMWPFVSRTRLPQFVGQFVDMEIPEDISPGRNLQVIPYGLLSSGRYLDGQSGFRSETERRAGVDARMVLKDAFTLDMALNPDFSQVESDEPQVLVNQRYEVYFPEKRPFFMEKASLFVTPEQLFFSRRIADPQFGARLTGTVGRWSMGLLAADDRAPGRLVSEGDSEFGDRAIDAVFRLERGLGRQSHIGVLATSHHFGARLNHAAGVDTRLRLARNWVFAGQATASASRFRGDGRSAGPAYYASLSKSGLNFTYSSTYRDRSPGFRADLGYIPRVDIREWGNSARYRWRPRSGRIVSYGPGVSQLVNWNRRGRVQDWSARPYFALELRGSTNFQVWRTESFEWFHDRGFRKNSTGFWAETEWYRWLALSADYSRGRAVDYYPGSGLAPFLARSTTATLTVTLRATPRLRFDESYHYSRLGAQRDWLPEAGLPAGAIYNNHILRSKVNYQFTRELSLRGIFDYNGVLPDARLISLENVRTAGVDVLLTYLLHPGVAVYAGYSNTRENLAYDAMQNPVLRRTDFPDTTTGRQLFI